MDETYHLAWAQRAVVEEDRWSEDGAGPWALLPRVCRAAVQRLGFDGASISMWTSLGLTTVAASSAWAASCSELDLVLGEGAGHLACDAGVVVSVCDIDQMGSEGWVDYRRATTERGLTSVLTAPINVHGSHVGALGFYRRRGGADTPQVRARAVALSEVVGDHLREAGEDVGDSRWFADDALARHSNVIRVLGMAMASLGVDQSEALSYLRARAYAGQTTLVQLAHDLSTSGTPFYLEM